MKKTMLFAAGLLISLAACAQKLKEEDVPAAVKDAFKNSWKDVKKVKWEKEGATFEGSFEIGETDQSVVYDATGRLIETEVEIRLDELPPAVKAYIAEHYKGAKIKEAAKITDANKLVTYEAEVDEKDLIFDGTGKFMKEQADQKENKD